MRAELTKQLAEKCKSGKMTDLEYELYKLLRDSELTLMDYIQKCSGLINDNTKLINENKFLLEQLNQLSGEGSDIGVTNLRFDMIAAIDCDLTIVDSAYHWWIWLEDMTNLGLSYDQVCHNYDLSISYSQVWLEKGMNGTPYDFWRSRNLYDDMTPIEGTLDAVHSLKDAGYKIVFVSILKGDHHKSKYNFLKRNFPLDAFVGTKEKWTVSADMIIDDRNKCLNMFPSNNTSKIKVITPFSQDEELKVNVDYQLTNWYDFSDLVNSGIL